MDVVTILLIVVLFVLWYCYQVYYFNYWKREGVYYVKPTIPYGNIGRVFKQEINIGDHMRVLYDQIKGMKEPYGGLYCGLNPVFLLTDPELIKTILVKDYRHFYDRGFHFAKYVPAFFKNLIFLHGKQWKRIRSKISPTFTPHKMAVVFDNIIGYTKNLNNVLDAPSNSKESIDIDDVMGRLIIDNIAISTFGFESNTLLKKNPEFFDLAVDFKNFVFKNKLMNLLVFLPFLLIIAIPLYCMKVIRVRSYFTGILRRNIRDRQENHVDKNDFLDAFIRLMKQDGYYGSDVIKGDCISFDELAANAFSFYIGGYDSTETALSFGMLELALNQRVQDVLRKEILDTLDSSEGDINYDILMDMKYLDQVVSEILRLYPIIPVIFRECDQEYTIKKTGYVIKKGTKVWVPILGLHMDPEYYPDPKEFKPERFSPEEISKRKPYTYMPFGEGHRICVGKRFAILQMKVAIFRLIQSYKFTVDPKMTLPVGFDGCNIFLGPRNKIWLNATKVTNERNILKN